VCSALEKKKYGKMQIKKITHLICLHYNKITVNKEKNSKSYKDI